MAYLYLNFLDNLDKGLGDKAWGRNDFFTQSLNEQYEALKRKLGGYAPDTLQEFIGYTFPSTPKYYTVSLPSFDRVMAYHEGVGEVEDQIAYLAYYYRGAELY